jgi:hypothetical protein
MAMKCSYFYFSLKANFHRMKSAILFVILFGSLATNSWGQYVVNFEGTNETNTSYAAATVNLSGINWSIGPEALIGTSNDDWKNGDRSLRLRARDGSLAEMIADKANGIGTISFDYRRYLSDADQQPYAVEYSTDGGNTWTQIGSPITATGAVQTFNETVNVTGNIRIRFRLTTTPGNTGNRRLNIDDITITDYTGPTPTLSTSVSTLSGLDYIAGSGPSAEFTYTLSGSNLVGSGNIVVTAPINFQVSLTSGSGFANSINVPYASGIVNGQPRTIYVRLNAGLGAQCAEYSGNITHSGGGASAIDVSVAGIVSATLLPPLHDLSSMDYSFTSFSSGNQCRTYPARMRFWRAANILTTPTTADPTANYEGAYNLTSGSRISGQGANGVSFVATSSPGAGIPFGAAVGLSSTGRENIQVTWVSRMVAQGNGSPTPREFRMRLQYRIGGSGSWVDVPGPIEYTSSGKTNGSSETLTATLPAVCDNQTELYVRWIYYEQAANSGGTRPEIGLDDITITSSPLSTSTITTANNVTGAPFTMSSCASTQSGSISYTISGAPFNQGNVFTAELSDANGNFSQPLAIGSLTSTLAGTISITIPENLPTGTQYRIRVVGSDPQTTGSQSDAFTITQNGSYCPSIGDYQTTASGTWASVGTWQTYNYVPASKSRAWQNATVQPNNANVNVYIRDGHTVTLSDGPKSIKNLVIDNGGRLYRNNTSCANLQYINLGGNILCNGDFGNGTTPDAIGVNVQVGAHTIHGSGSFNAQRIRLSDEENNFALRGSATLTLDMDVTLRYNPSSCSGGSNAIYSNRTASETFDVIINGGKTLTITDPLASFGMDGANVPPTVYPATDRGGGYTVYGNIICEGFYMLGSNNVPANRKPYLNIKNGGLVRVAYLDFGDNNAASGGELIIEGGGILEITGASAGNSWLNTNVGSINFNIQLGSLVQYNSNSNQTIPGNLFTYSKLAKAGTGTLNLNSDLTVAGTLFLQNGVIATGANDLIISNSNPGAVVGPFLPGFTKYVHGRLIRNTNNGEYIFPIGNPTYGYQGFTIAVNGSGNVLGFLENNNTPPLYDRAYCDIETTNAPQSQIGQGTPGQDGFLDRMIFNLSSPLQWNVTNPGGGITSYDITVHANGTNDINPVIAADGTKIRFLLKNGEPGNTGVPTGNVPGEFNEIGFLACPNGETLTGMTSFSTFTINGSSGSNTELPIELLYFNAFPKNGWVELNWATASELNNNYFTVERSADGFNWEEVLQTPGAGTTTLQSNYTKFDTRPLSGLSYYRLKQTDMDGKFSYSNIVSVVINTENKQLVRVINMLGQEVKSDTKGMVILMFSNGESLKLVNE